MLQIGKTDLLLKIGCEFIDSDHSVAMTAVWIYRGSISLSSQTGEEFLKKDASWTELRISPSELLWPSGSDGMRTPGLGHVRGRSEWTTQERTTIACIYKYQ